MEKLFEQVSPTSKKLYLHNLKKLNGEAPTNLRFLKDTKTILERLEVLKPNTRKSYLIAIVKALKMSGIKSNMVLYDVYYPYLEELNKQGQNNSKMTGGEMLNWVNDKELDEQTDMFEAFVDKIKLKRKLTDQETKILQDYVIFSLYTKTIPRRATDYVRMTVSAPTEDKSVNYYHKGKFYFNNYKTQGTYGTQTMDVPPKLDNLLKLWLRFKSKDSPFLLLNKGKPFSQSSYITTILNTIFGRKVSVNMLRKYYATKTHGAEKKKLEETATAMGNSPETLKNHYIKTEE